MFTKKQDYEYRKIDSLTDRMKISAAGFPALSKLVRENAHILRGRDYGIFGIYSNIEKRFISIIVTAKSIILINSMHILLYEVRNGYPVRENLEKLFDSFIEVQYTEPCITASIPNSVYSYISMFEGYGMKAYEITVDADEVGIKNIEQNEMVQTTIMVRTHGMYERVSPLPRRVSPTFPRIREFVEVEKSKQTFISHPAFAGAL